MPMIPETVIGMLACARIGAIHSVVFGGFASACAGQPAHRRAAQGRPDRLVRHRGQSGGPRQADARRGDRAGRRHARLLHRASASRGEGDADAGADHDWHELAAGAGPVDCVPVLATDPLYILYTSGTTGNPKGIIRDNGGHPVGLTWSMRNVYGVEPGEVYWAASDGLGGGSLIHVHGPLSTNTTVLYEGKLVGTPDAARSGRSSRSTGCAPSPPRPRSARSSVTIPRASASAATICRSSALYSLPASAAIRRPSSGPSANLGSGHRPLVVTETGWPVGCNCPGLGLLPVKPGSCAVPVPGWDVRLLDEQGREAAPGEQGNVVIKLRSRRAAPTLWNNDQGFRKTYLDTTLATTSRPTPATRTRTATSGSWVAPTT